MRVGMRDYTYALLTGFFFIRKCEDQSFSFHNPQHTLLRRTLGLPSKPRIIGALVVNSMPVKFTNEAHSLVRRTIRLLGSKFCHGGIAVMKHVRSDLEHLCGRTKTVRGGRRHDNESSRNWIREGSIIRPLLSGPSRGTPLLAFRTDLGRLCSRPKTSARGGRRHDSDSSRTWKSQCGRCSAVLLGVTLFWRFRRGSAPAGERNPPPTCASELDAKDRLTFSLRNKSLNSHSTSERKPAFSAS
ncbi:hypothetical protein JB92DRAFT_2883684 [Gautieria morchelliformis]|nr:hypothetical protein JB92DRAFT_2883684 [Gautieria morchelliformis]